MADDDLHKQVLDLIRRAEHAAYERGKADAKRELLAFLGARTAVFEDTHPPSLVNDTSAASSTQERQRAPKGIVPKFVKRVLRQYAGPRHGLTPQEIRTHAESEHEKMIKPASIRSELRNGRTAGRYREVHGRWFLANGGEEKEEAEAPTKEHSASMFEQTERR